MIHCHMNQNMQISFRLWIKLFCILHFVITIFTKNKACTVGKKKIRSSERKENLFIYLFHSNITNITRKIHKHFLWTASYEAYQVQLGIYGSRRSTRAETQQFVETEFEINNTVRHLTQIEIQIDDNNRCVERGRNFSFDSKQK